MPVRNHDHEENDEHSTTTTSAGIRVFAALLLLMSFQAALLPDIEAEESSRRTDIAGIAGNAFPWESRWPEYQPVLAGTNAGWARVELRWEYVNPQPGTWRWEHYDSLVASYEETGFEQLGLLVYSVGWATSQGGSGAILAPPDDFDAWEEYVRRMAERYHDQISAWEVWNEPDVAAFWGGQDGGNPEIYLELLKRAHRAIKSVDPDATVMNGGLTGTERGASFLNRLLDLGGGPYLDAVAFHGYVPDDGFDTMIYPDVIWPLISAARERSGKPLWITEFGWSSGCAAGAETSACSEADQASRIARHLPMLFAIGGVERVFLFRFKDEDHAPDSYELVHANGTTKPAYAAFSTIVRELNGLKYERRIDLGADVWAMRFSGPDRTVDIVWSTRGPKHVQIPTVQPNITTVTSTGERVERSVSGAVAIEIGTEPVLVVREGQEPVGDHCRHFPETGQTLCDRFLRFWEDYGGLEIFGYPLSPELVETGRRVQYLERMKFEYQPEAAGTDWEVVGELVGRTITAGREAEAPFAAVHDPRAGGECRFFPETGHGLCDGFRKYWESHGGLWMFGYPISEEFVEHNPDTGDAYNVQYFERARFEWHPENRGTVYEVLVGRLGAQLYHERY